MPRPAPAAAPAADFTALLAGLLALIEAHRARVTSAAALALWAAVSNVVALARVYAAAPGLWTLRTATTTDACALSLDRPADWHEHPGAAPPAAARDVTRYRMSPAVLALRLAMFAVDTRRALGLPLRRRRPRLVLLQGGRAAGPRPAAE